MAGRWLADGWAIAGDRWPSALMMRLGAIDPVNQVRAARCEAAARSSNCGSEYESSLAR
jgi:hypothetical protein